jgi:hypothetical protein
MTPGDLVYIRDKPYKVLENNSFVIVTPWNPTRKELFSILWKPLLITFICGGIPLWSAYLLNIQRSFLQTLFMSLLIPSSFFFVQLRQARMTLEWNLLMAQTRRKKGVLWN